MPALIFHYHQAQRQQVYQACKQVGGPQTRSRSYSASQQADLQAYSMLDCQEVPQ